MATSTITVFYPGEFEDVFAKIDGKMIRLSDLIAKVSTIENATVDSVLPLINCGLHNIPVDTIINRAYSDDIVFDYPEDFGGYFIP